ncbi:hypothetical protein FHS18_000502 [Paenibacillus phyllosphaerae]|uniref:HNH nuclease domain-containing protein n=1 Tax=Paenibacillus phyllosphaerae TaxID=274593 RepID=A0A7W5ATV2_9BACL|nr:HNH endonuclease signature motif containing protein [Paenibacillus phyllosphaerae]MBB3108474.1 hypothetical protein [Paenibacillus phyllosphaerae]
MDVKQCGVCGQEKPLTSFTKRSGRSGRRGTCRSCLRRRGRADDPAETAGAEDRLPETKDVEALRPMNGNAVIAAPVDTGQGHDQPEDSTVEETAEGSALLVPESAEPAKKKRKRKRRRRRKVIQLSEQPADTDSAAEAIIAAKSTDAKVEEQTDHADIADASYEEADDVTDLTVDAPAKKRKRRRRRRKSKAKQVLTSSLMPEGEQQAGFDWKPAAAKPGESELTLVHGAAAGIGSLSPSEEQKEAADADGDTSPRKRKRRRRRKRRANAAVVETEAAPPVRPPYKRIVPIKGRFTYDPSILDDRGTGLIRLRGRRETGKRWSTEIPTEMAVRMVAEGAAGIIHPSLIHKLYSKTDFRLLILQRDNYVCKYCGRFGDTIDHVMPKSKGGLSTPDNCVCACAECNLRKADHLDFVFDEL